jgi:hypothetical protein
MPKARRALLALALTAATFAFASAPQALASNAQESLFEDDVALLHDPAGTLQELRHLGVTMVRLNVRWSFIAPDPKSFIRPHFNAADSNAYPAGAWSVYDEIVRDAQVDGIQLMFTPTAFAPLWAQGKNPKKYGAHYNWEFAFMPSANEYKQFVEALGKRYPSVHTWELYNEPNFGEDLSPQGINHSNVLYAPVMYRSLINAGWSALHATGHGDDTILIGSLAAHGAHIPSKHSTGLPGAYGETPPLEFVRELYCLDSHYRSYRRAAAKVRRCPATAKASRRFRRQNPALFNAGGFSIHPYPLGPDGGLSPTQTSYHNANYAGFTQIPNLIKALDHVQRAYQSFTQLPVWDTEYGYITNPPNRSEHYVSPATQAYYDNWAEYLSWKNPRILSTMQYLLYDPNPSVGTPECGGFASGLVYFQGAPITSGCGSYTPGSTKPAYDAYRLPIFMPSGGGSPGKPLTVWGCVRPAFYALFDTQQPQTALIQFQRGSVGPWLTVATVTYSSLNQSCYFTRQVTLPASGSVRLAWDYPLTDIGQGGLTPAITTNLPDALTPAVSRTLSVSIG